MAARHKELEKISTTEILEELRKANGDTSEFFYLYVSTSGTERKRQNRRKLPPDQPTLDKYVLYDSDSESSEVEEDDAQMECDDDVDTTENTTQSATPSADNNSLPFPSGSKKVREATMDLVHKHVRQEVLYPDGWKKVCDKDQTTTYRALYFNIIKRRSNEDPETHILRVNEVRETIRKEADKIKAEHRVNFKINTLLSKPFLYDEPTLKEQSMSQGSTQRRRQTKLDEYADKKT